MFDSNKYCTRVAKFLKLTLYYTIRHPAYPRKFIQSKILDQMLIIDEDELSEYVRVSDRRNFLSYSVCILYFVMFFKYISIAIYNIYKFEHSNMGSAISEVARGQENISSTDFLLADKKQQQQIVHKFYCIATNCTRIQAQSASLKEDIGKLPVLSICNPILSGQYTPMISLDAPAILAHMTLGFCLLTCFTNYIVQILLAIPNDSLMLFVAPQISAQMIKNKISVYLFDIQRSLMNYGHLNSKLEPERYGRVRSATRLKAHSDPGDGMPTLTPCNRAPTERCSFNKIDPIIDEEAGQFKSIDSRSSNDAINIIGQQRGDFMDDNLPAVRTDWWRNKMAGCIHISFFFLTVETLAAVFTIMIIVQYYIYLKKQELFKYASYIRSQNCAIWLNSEDASKDRELIELDKIPMNWSALKLLELFLCIALPLFNTCCFLLFFQVCFCELNCWLNELKLKTEVAIEYARLFKVLLNLTPMPSMSHGPPKPSTALPSTQPQVNLEKHHSHGTLFVRPPTSKNYPTINVPLILREDFKRCTKVLVQFLVKTKPICVDPDRELKSEFEISMAREEYAIHLLFNRSNKLSVYNDLAEISDQVLFEQQLQLIELIKSLYINYRIFMQAVRQYAQSIVCILVACNLLAYSLTFMAIYLNHYIRDFRTEPLVIVISCLGGINVYIGSVASFHARVSFFHQFSCLAKSRKS